MNPWPVQERLEACPPALAVVDAAIGRLGGDAFLSGGPRSEARRWVVGVAPAAELRPRGMDRDAIRAFAFRGPGPALGFLPYAWGLGEALGVRRDPGFPPGLLRRYHGLLEWDLPAGTLTIAADDPGLARDLRDLVRSSAREGPSPSRFLRGKPPRPSGTREEYVGGVRETLEAIRDGRVYQLNLSLRWEAAFEPRHSWPLFLHLFRRWPASHYAYLDAGTHRLISTSPERFLQVRRGRVLSQPIKGTLRVPPGVREEPLQAALAGSPKESAELSMIVDLIRNDLSRSCLHGSVTVPVHKAVFRVDDLLQMCSDVEGILRPDRDVVDLLAEAFPGGSVTGCPKEAAMELIDALEGRPRNAYCGAFILLEGPRDMDSSITIRTATVDVAAARLVFDAGSGIVVDSDPEAEYLETVAKAAKFLEVLA